MKIALDNILNSLHYLNEVKLSLLDQHTFNIKFVDANSCNQYIKLFTNSSSLQKFNQFRNIIKCLISATEGVRTS